MNLEREQFLKDFVQKEFELLMKNFKKNFVSWERFCKIDVICSYMCYTNLELNSVFKYKETSKKALEVIHTPLNEEESNFMIQYAFDFIKEKSVVEKSISEFMPLLSSFFNSLGVDFDSLNKEEQYSILNNEDINDKNKIYEKLNLTHIQFKYLYQQGSVLVME